MDRKLDLDARDERHGSSGQPNCFLVLQLVYLILGLVLSSCNGLDNYGKDNYCDNSSAKVTRLKVSKESWKGKALVLSASASAVTKNQSYDKKSDNCNKSESEPVDVSASSYPVEIYLCQDGKINHLNAKTGATLTVSDYDVTGTSALILYSFFSDTSLREYDICQGSTVVGDATPQNEAFNSCKEALLAQKICSSVF